MGYDRKNYVGKENGMDENRLLEQEKRENRRNYISFKETARETLGALS